MRKGEMGINTEESRKKREEREREGGRRKRRVVSYMIQLGHFWECNSVGIEVTRPSATA